MTEIPLKQFCEMYPQSRAAEIIGCTQGAISQMTKAGREVFITCSETGEFSWYEIKRPKKSAA